MGETAHESEPLRERLQCHVLKPIGTAERAVERERQEVLTERRAFDAFADRVAEIEPVVTRAPATTPRRAVAERDASRLERVRRAFRETVMDVPHYDDVYGEPLAVHAAEELSTALAAGFRDGTGTTFSPAYKQMLEEAIAIAIANREQYCTTLESEKSSLANARETLVDALAYTDQPWAADRDDVPVPARLDELARDRQTELHTRTLSTRVDAHDLCHHLYGDAEWTYPVLTAVARANAAMDSTHR